MSSEEVSRMQMRNHLQKGPLVICAEHRVYFSTLLCLSWHDAAFECVHFPRLLHSFEYKMKCICWRAEQKSKASKCPELGEKLRKCEKTK